MDTRNRRLIDLSGQQSMNDIRKTLIDEIMTWRGTPYHDQARIKNVGVDCIGLIVGVALELQKKGIYLIEREIKLEEVPEQWKYYSPFPTGEIRTALEHYLIPTDFYAPGDILEFRWKPNYPPQHCGFMVHDNCMVHALSRKKVQWHTIDDNWWGKLTRAYTWPILVQK